MLKHEEGDNDHSFGFVVVYGTHKPEVSGSIPLPATIKNNMKKNLSILQNFKSENFFYEPLPHLIINNALPDDLYDELENTIGEPPDGIFFNFTTQVTQCNEDNRNKEVERRLIVSMNSYTTEGGDCPIIIKEYIEKHRNFYRKYERINIRG